jgi:hypothetical protein
MPMVATGSARGVVGPARARPWRRLGWRTRGGPVSEEVSQPRAVRVVTRPAA